MANEILTGWSLKYTAIDRYPHLIDVQRTSVVFRLDEIGITDIYHFKYR
jgi:hypothetical protein